MWLCAESMPRLSVFPRAWALLALAVSLIVLIPGCSTPNDAENLSERPWNAPKNWEGGMPSGLFEGR